MMQELKGMDEEEMLETMPDRLHRDIAMDMHMDIIRKVKLFQVLTIVTITVFMTYSGL